MRKRITLTGLTGYGCLAPALALSRAFLSTRAVFPRPHGSPGRAGAALAARFAPAPVRPGSHSSHRAVMQRVWLPSRLLT